MHPLYKKFVCLKTPTRWGYAVVSVRRNDVDTLLSFRSQGEAMRARKIMSSGVWVYRCRRECEFLPKVPAMRHSADDTWTVTGQQLVERGIHRFGVDECEVDEDGCIVMVEAYFLNRDVSYEEARAKLVHMESGWSPAKSPGHRDGDHGDHGGDVRDHDGL